MCTAVTYQTKDHYFGRTLDYDFAYPHQIVFMPRKFPLHFRHGEMLKEHYAMIGMAYVAEGYPLYFDAINEKGLGIAGLNFVGNACYRPPAAGKNNVAVFEFVPWLLAQCDSVAQAKERLQNVQLTDTAFSKEVQPSQLHWLIADGQSAITVEAVKEGLHIYENPVGVLTNNPTFDQQLFRLNDYMHLSNREPGNQFSPKLTLTSYSRGMGALGLPGDLSSQSRFVRASFVKMNSVSAETEAESVSQFFHILGSVAQPRGCCQVENGAFEITIYTSCCNLDRGIYYYTTYDNQQISAVDMHKTALEHAELICYPLRTEVSVFCQN